MTFKKGFTPRNKGKSKANGDILRYGRPRSDITKKNISKVKKGKPAHPNSIAGTIKARTGKTYEEIFGEKKGKELRENKKGKAPWNKNLTKKEDRRIAKYAKKLTGKKMSEISRKKMSDSKRGIKHSESHKLKIKLGNSTPSARKRHREIRLNTKNSRKPSDLEIKIHNQLTEAGIQFSKEVPLEGITKADFVIKTYNTHFKALAIYADGCAVHACPIHPNRLSGRLKLIDEEIRTRDGRINMRLTQKNYCVIRIWGHDILKGDFNIVEYIKKYILPKEHPPIPRHLEKSNYAMKNIDI